MNIPADLKYTKEHEWVRLEGNVATIGITDWAQGELGDVVFVEMPDVGSEVAKSEQFGTIEAVKAVSELYAPLSGKVIEINGALDDDPMAVNRDPFGDGWMIRIEISEKSEIDSLFDDVGYKGIIG